MSAWIAWLYFIPTWVLGCAPLCQASVCGHKICFWVSSKNHKHKQIGKPCLCFFSNFQITCIWNNFDNARKSQLMSKHKMNWYFTQWFLWTILKEYNWNWKSSSVRSMHKLWRMFATPTLVPISWANEWTGSLPSASGVPRLNSNECAKYLALFIGLEEETFSGKVLFSLSIRPVAAEPNNFSACLKEIWMRPTLENRNNAINYLYALAAQEHHTQLNCSIV